MPRIRPLRRTKIVCTLGPATDAPGMLRSLLFAGVDVVRLNAAHGTEAELHARIVEVRRIAGEIDRSVAVLLDLPGPKLRLGRLEGDVLELARGARIVLAGRGGRGTVPIRVPSFARRVRRGESIALADGSVRLRIERVAGDRVHCRVELGGTVRSGSGVNLPESDLTMRLPTAADGRWIEFAKRERVDWIGVSFVRDAADVAAVRRRLGDDRERPAVMAKIEKRSAVEALEEIITGADGVMVARGDLGVETALVEVPIVQKRVIAAAIRLGRPVVTATQMLESMVEAPVPTRAEVADVANAVLDGTDAVMLSAETAIGRYPLRAVETLRDVAVASEPSYPFGASLTRWNPRGDVLEAALSAEACRLAGDLDAKALVVPAFDLEHVTAISRLRPGAPILAFTDVEGLRRQLAILWGVETAVLATDAPLEARLTLVRRWLRARWPAGGSAVMLSTSGVGPRRLDTLRVIEIGAGRRR